MKNYKFTHIILALLIALFIMALGAPAQAAITIGTETITDYQGFSVHDATLTMTTSGTVAWPSAINGIVIAVETDPGTTAPTDNYDITLVNDRGADIMGTALMNRDTANTEITCPTLGYASEVPTTGILTVTVTNQSVSAATVKLRIYVREEKKGILSW